LPKGGEANIFAVLIILSGKPNSAKSFIVLIELPSLMVNTHPLEDSAVGRRGDVDVDHGEEVLAAGLLGQGLEVEGLLALLEALDVGQDAGLRGGRVGAAAERGRGQEQRGDGAKRIGITPVVGRSFAGR
jgi:hypothetical protein